MVMPTRICPASAAKRAAAIDGLQHLKLGGQKMLPKHQQIKAQITGQTYLLNGFLIAREQYLRWMLIGG